MATVETGQYIETFVTGALAAHFMKSGIYIDVVLVERDMYNDCTRVGVAVHRASSGDPMLILHSWTVYAEIPPRASLTDYGERYRLVDLVETLIVKVKMEEP